MANNNFVRDGHVFQWKFDKYLGNAPRFGVIINPNNINVNILGLNFTSGNIAFYEGVEDVGEPVTQIEPLAHNRSLGVKSRIKFKTVDQELKYERKLFDWKEYSRWITQNYSHIPYNLTEGNYNATGWILNKNKKYAFFLRNNTSISMDFSVAMLWNEYW